MSGEKTNEQGVSAKNHHTADQTRGDKDLPQMKKELGDLKKQLEERESVLRKLSLAKTFKNKKEFTELEGLSEKWRQACQEAILVLHHGLPEPKPSLQELIDSWHLDYELVRFNPEEEGFD